MSKLAAKVKKFKSGLNLLNQLANADSPKIVEMEGLTRFLENTKSKLLEPKLDKTSNANTFYANDDTSQPISITYTNQAVGNTACMRDANGRTKVMQGAEGQDAVNYAQMNIELAKKSPKLVAGDNIILTENPDGTITISATGTGKDTWEGLKFTAQEDGATVSYSAHGTVDTSGIQYSYNGKEWHDWNPDEVLTLTNGEHVDVKNTNNTLNTSEFNYLQFAITSGKIAASGNVNSMINFAELSNYCYFRMFRDCTSLTAAPSLPSMVLASDCYELMFYNCTSLTQAPGLPATELANHCYNAMFYGCTSLTQAPELPATQLATSCYYQMFYNCTLLTQAPVLPATELTTNCYFDMFRNCTSLTQAPSLPATQLANSCYCQMFYSCASLTQAPELPATELAIQCYYRMFFNCTSLTQAPELSATELANHCCNSMFYGCTSLIQAPELSATELAGSCYYCMFYGCTSLKINNQYGTKIFTCPSKSGLSSDPTSNMFTSTGGEFTGTPVEGTTYYYTE